MIEKFKQFVPTYYPLFSVNKCESWLEPNDASINFSLVLLFRTLYILYGMAHSAQKGKLLAIIGDEVGFTKICCL